MSLIALLTWIVTASLGLYLLSVWLIEYDKDFQADAETRLPPLVLAAHVTLGVGGLIVWAYYLFFDNTDLAWISTGAVLHGGVAGHVHGLPVVRRLPGQAAGPAAGTDQPRLAPRHGGRA